MKKRSAILYAALWILLLCWLFVSTNLVCHISGHIQPREIVFDDAEYGESNQYVYYSYSTLNVLGTLDESFRIIGWAFTETEEPSPQRYTSVILAGEQESYEFRIHDLPERNDVGSALSNKKIPDKHVGIYHDFSTASIKNGTYDLYIYCWENENDHGLVNTGYQLSKHYEEIVVGPGASLGMEDGVTVTEMERCKRAIDKIFLEDGLLQVKGWTFVPDQDTKTQMVYVSLTDGSGKTLIYKANNNVRPDVAKAYKSELYENSGYNISVPEEDIPDGVWILRILMEYDGKVWASAPIDMVKTGGTVELRPA